MVKVHDVLELRTFHSSRSSVTLSAAAVSVHNITQSIFGVICMEEQTATFEINLVYTTITGTNHIWRLV